MSVEPNANLYARRLLLKVYQVIDQQLKKPSNDQKEITNKSILSTLSIGLSSTDKSLLYERITRATRQLEADGLITRTENRTPNKSIYYIITEIKPI